MDSGGRNSSNEVQGQSFGGGMGEEISVLKLAMF